MKPLYLILGIGTVLVLLAIAISLALPASIFRIIPPGASETQRDISGAVITLERTACFGTCPVYSLTISGTGEVAYTGKDFVTVTGSQTAVIPVESVRELVDKFYAINFFAMNDTYEAAAADLPSANVSISLNGQEKSVENRGSGPRELFELENAIDDVSVSSRWVNGPFIFRKESAWGPCPAAETCTQIITISPDGMLTLRGNKDKVVRLSLDDISALKRKIHDLGIMDRKCEYRTITDYSATYIFIINGRTKAIRFPGCEIELDSIDKFISYLVDRKPS